jgi:carbon monoxide dehydrogenase subunit G
MEITGSYLLPCSPETAWQALNDTDVLKSCLKGCEALERTAENEFTGKVAAKIGPVSARFSGTMRQTELDPPRSCRMQFEGQGGVAGFAKGGALVTLAVREGGTELTYVADTQIGGKLAQMGARLVEGTAKSMADDFFGKFAAAVAAMEPGASPASAPAADAPPAEQTSGTPAWLLPVVIAAMAVAAVVLFLQ